eukprot:3941477-Rhodomonas_salina.3
MSQYRMPVKIRVASHAVSVPGLVRRPTAVAAPVPELASLTRGSVLVGQYRFFSIEGVPISKDSVGEHRRYGTPPPTSAVPAMTCTTWYHRMHTRQYRCAHVSTGVHTRQSWRAHTSVMYREYRDSVGDRQTWATSPKYSTVDHRSIQQGIGARPGPLHYSKHSTVEHWSIQLGIVARPGPLRARLGDGTATSCPRRLPEHNLAQHRDRQYYTRASYRHIHMLAQYHDRLAIR